MTRLRPYEPTDAAGALALNQANVPEVGSVDAERWAWLVDLAEHVEVVEADGEVVALLVGLAEGSDYDSPNYRWYNARHERFAYVDRVAVAEAFRGSGIAQDLYRSFETWARGRGADVLCAEVNTVPPNPRSLRFHQRLGFDVVADLEPWPDTEPGHRVAMVEKPLTGSGGVVDDDYCYLTTTGRRSGRPHRIEIWYAADGDTLYLLAGGGRSSDWVRNLEADPAVSVELDGRIRQGHATILDGAGDRADRARSLVFAKYQPRGHGDLTRWRDTALPVVIELATES